MGEPAQLASGGRSTFLWVGLMGAMEEMEGMSSFLLSPVNICSVHLGIAVVSMQRMGEEDLEIIRWVGEEKTT